jgi:hypothetical protein
MALKVIGLSNFEVRLSAHKWPLNGLIWLNNGLIGRLFSLSMLSEMPECRMMSCILHGAAPDCIGHRESEIHCKVFVR